MLLLIIAAFIWGITSPINRHALSFTHPLFYTAFRYLFAAMSLAPLVLRWGRRQAPADYFFHDVGRWSWLKGGLWLGTFLTLASILQYYGLTFTTASKSGFITSLYVPMVALFGFVLGQLPRRQVWIGLGLCMIGLLFLSRSGAGGGFNFGDALTLTADLIWAGHIMIMGYFVHRVNPWRLVAAQSIVCSLLCFGLVFWTDNLGSWAEFKRSLPFMLWGIVAVSVAYVCQAVAQINTSATATAIIMQVQPVLGAAVGIIFLKEEFYWGMVVGAVFLISGALVARRGGEAVRVNPKAPRYKLVMVARVAMAVSLLLLCVFSLVFSSRG